MAILDVMPRRRQAIPRIDRTTGRTKSLSDATVPVPTSDGYDRVLGDILGLLEQSRRTAARAVNALMTTTYWAIGRRIVDEEQGGRGRAAYGEALLKRLSADLTRRFGRGFSERNLEQMRLFYAAWPISQTPSAKSSPAHPALDISQTLSAKSPPFSLDTVAPPFPLLRARALDACWREPACRPCPVRRKGCGRGPLRSRRAARQNSRRRIPHGLA